MTTPFAKMNTRSPRKADQTRQPGSERPELSTTEYNEPRVKETTSTKPPKQKQTTQTRQGVGGATSTAGSGAAAKLAKDEKKKQKAERRVCRHNYINNFWFTNQYLHLFITGSKEN